MPYLRVQDEALFYQERGSGPLALFLHGFALDHTLWLNQLTTLAPLRRCVAIDLRGFGRSGTGLDPGATMSHHIDDVIDAVAFLGAETADLVGLSLGAHLARDVASRRPDMVRSLALLGIMSREEYVFPATRSAELLSLTKDELALRYATPMLSPDPPVARLARVMAMAGELNWSILYPPVRQAPSEHDEVIDFPRGLLFMTGADDRITPPDAVSRLAAKHPKAVLRIVPDAGHLVPIEQPAAVSDAVAGLWSGSATV